jgi:hypothetical protein
VKYLAVTRLLDKLSALGITIHEVRFGLWQNNLSAEPAETAFEEAGRIATDEVGFDPAVAVAARGRYLRAELLVTTTIPVAVTW